MDRSSTLTTDTQSQYNEFYVANASPFTVRVRIMNDVSNYLHIEANTENADMKSQDVSRLLDTIANGHWRPFKGSVFQLFDNAGRFFYETVASPSTSFIISYATEAQTYSIDHYLVNKSLEIPRESMNADDIWKAADGTNYKTNLCKPLALGEFCVANCLSEKIKVELRNLGANRHHGCIMSVAAAECSSYLNSSTVCISCLVDDEEKIIFDGGTAPFSGRAIIVTKMQSIQSSVLLNETQLPMAMWISDPDKNNHYPYIFYVANASKITIHVEATTAGIPSGNGEFQSDAHKTYPQINLQHGEYREFRGCYVRILTDDSKRICEIPVNHDTSVIVQGKDPGNILLSDKIKSEGDTAEAVWRAASGINYNPRWSFYVANGSAAAVHVQASVVSTNNEASDQYKCHPIVESGGYREFRGSHVKIWSKYGKPICCLPVDEKISVIVTNKDDIVFSAKVVSPDNGCDVWDSADGTSYKRRGCHMM